MLSMWIPKQACIHWVISLYQLLARVAMLLPHVGPLAGGAQSI